MIYKLIILTFGFFYCSLTYPDADSASDELITNSKHAIDLCMEEYLMKSGNPAPDEIDSIVVQSFSNGYGINFTRGEIGSFGKQSTDYKLFLSCGISLDGEIKYLGIPFGDSLKGNLNDVNFVVVDGVMEILFRRVNNQLEYCCSQVMNDNNIEMHNPELFRSNQGKTTVK